MNVGLDPFRMVQGPGADEQGVAGRGVVFAPQARPAIAAKEHLVRFAAARRQHDGFRQAVVGLYAILLDPHVEDERAARLFLAIAAMAGVNDQRRGNQPVPHRTAGASPFMIHLYPPSFDPVIWALKVSTNTTPGMFGENCADWQAAIAIIASENLFGWRVWPITEASKMAVMVRFTELP